MVGECLIDHGYLLAAGAIVSREVAAAHQRNTHGAQIFRRDGAIVCFGLLPLLGRAWPRNRKLLVPQKPLSGRKSVAPADFTPGSVFNLRVTSLTNTRTFVVSERG
jgi:hypothetical protein